MAVIRKIQCHSDFQHYQMRHRYTSRYDNFEYKTTYNFYGGSICGGSVWGGICGGAAIALGAAIGQFITGGRSYLNNNNFFSCGRFFC